MIRAFLVVSFAMTLAQAGLTGEALWVRLGPDDQPQGLHVSQQPDGRTLPAEFDGRACRRTDIEGGSAHMYVHVDPDFTPPDRVFVTVEFFDQHGVVSIHYDAGEGLSAYTPTPEAYPQRGSYEWRTETFTLLRPQFMNRQNGGADFRLFADGPFAVSRITLTTEPPEGFQVPIDPNTYFAERPAVTLPPDMDLIQQWQIHEPVPEGQLADSAYETAKQIGVTSLQSYVGWAQLEPEQGVLDFSLYDPVVDQIRRHDLKWLPFLIVGPLVATPEWWRAEYGVDYVCLEHSTATPIQSMWNPNLKAGVRRFLEIFREHYEPDVIEALNLGISGNWGESIVVAGGGFNMGDNHTHIGWWCGDEHAQAHFRQWVEARYETLDTLNAAWGASHEAWDDITPFIPADAPSRRAAVDVTTWYTQSMTDYAEFWVKTARELYPDLPIYLCTGGSGQPELAADFSAQARMCAQYNAGLRITNQSDDAPGNFAVTRMVSSATRLYDGYYTTEPAGANTPKGIAARIFDGVSGGASGLYFKSLVIPPDQPSATAVQFAENVPFLTRHEPKLSVAALMPNSSLAIEQNLIHTFLERTQRLRDALDYEFIDENMIADGLLERFRALVVLAGDTVEQPVLDRITAWLEAGGVLIIPQELGPLQTVEAEPATWWSDQFALRSDRFSANVVGNGYLVVVNSPWPGWCETMSGVLLSETAEFPWKSPLAEPLDGVYDGILATRVGDQVYYYNNADVPVEKEVPGHGVLTIPARGIRAIEWSP